MRHLAMTGAMGLLALAACSDGPGMSVTSRVDVGLTAGHATAPAASLMAGAEVQTDGGGNTLQIDSVFVVLRKIKLEGTACGGEDDSLEVHDSLDVHDSTDLRLDDDQGEAEDDCPMLRAGPILVQLPLDSGSVDHQFTATIDTGTYREVTLQIHKPEGANDTVFLAQHPDYTNTSVRVFGSFNGTPFTFSTGVTSVQHVEFEPPLVVTESPTSFTIRVDLSGWFRTEGGTLIDPASVAGDAGLAAVVNANIVHSFHAFRDEDHDGEDDHDE